MFVKNKELKFKHLPVRAIFLVISPSGVITTTTPLLYLAMSSNGFKRHGNYVNNLESTDIILWFAHNIFQFVGWVEQIYLEKEQIE